MFATEVTTQRVDFVVDEIDRRDLRDIVLVAHSWAVVRPPVPRSTRADRVAKVVYRTAVVVRRCGRRKSSTKLGDVNPVKDGSSADRTASRSGVVSAPARPTP
ncbi:hypothetical protein [Actinoplanes subtropicus]|uniref:hypothetical protein n=1 Tax=Actinoplanes subtropicus TaxID=543632 RepID=UPI0004C37D05|nr:hypothetical protein [Actinoplanes subtropicus]